MGEREATRLRRHVRLSPSTHTVLDLDDPRGVLISPGFTAYERWIEWLREAVEPRSLHSGTMILHEDICLRMKEMRSLAAEYLREVAPVRGEDARPHLQRAAQLYDTVADRICGPESPMVEPLTEKDEGAEQFMRENPRKWGEWPWVYTGLGSPASREKMAQALELCLDEERAAIGEIEAALASGKDA